MQISKVELVAQLEDEIEGVYGFPYTEHDYPWETFVWKISELGTFTLEKLLQDLGFIENIELEEYLFDFELEIQAGQSLGTKNIATQEKILQLEHKYQYFLRLLQTNLTNLQPYRISLKESNKNEVIGSFTAIIGRTINGYWFGIAPLLPYSKSFMYRTSEKFYIDTQKPSDAKIIDLWSNFKSATQELELPSELDGEYSGRESIVEVAETRELIIEKLLDSVGFIQTVEFNGGFGNLGQLLTENLTNTRIYIIWGFFIYLIGDTPDGDLIGVSTKAVWT
ncbi:hypothetical protein BV372_20745 [Nostoc sp. T09]|uniref:nuclease A inhibitor family protein n=1 Tax=Nostoc sp. T09 TaxID=1932621 RepID=UPI000A3C3572|nr:nuclease A inhibitor family protein [Nostoc sp. T09]OUL31238.1 hypothetical protein BV372_20745 [Nostoc sp. T09]